ncbi:HD-GYP domain-containing protein [Paenibacillus sp. XY044]|uniref:HD-GYP domain-containing protein n=1 Tax=Paenibacillus sp. XY044 TaxID=2026089 RepID=UPI000B97E307|nr:HD domain-containing phosphohydrolase [Paenibacillus sp. XY044]OZB90747.1 hypothetical protein CJP46_32055 [Paenibacillus sp. XY044]
MDTDSNRLQGTALYYAFRNKLVRNYIFGSLFAVFVVGSAIVLTTISVSPQEIKRLVSILAASVVVMIAAESWVFRRHIQPIKEGLSSRPCTVHAVEKAYRQAHRLPQKAVFRILVPHFLGLAVPAAGLTLWLLNRELLHFRPIYVAAAVIGAFLVASMHAMIEFFLTTAMVRPLVKELQRLALKDHRIDLNPEGHVVLSIRPKFLVSAMLIGISPLLLFTLAAQIRLGTLNEEMMTGYWGWAGLILMVDIIFTYTGAKLLTHEVEQPISHLYDAMNHVKDGRLRTIQNVYSDEFSRLATGFNMMVRALQSREAQSRAMLDSYFVTLAVALDARDAYTAGHSLRVAEYSELIGRLSQMTEEDINVIRQSALLHDIGKIGIRDTVLLKEGHLTEEEFDQIKAHPVLGETILKQIEPKEAMAPLLPGVRSHHERYDGGGYPDGLAGEDIPLLGRIIAVADAFDAMTSDRPYRKGMAVCKALSILEEGRGTQWDPQFARIFVDYMRQQGMGKAAGDDT